MGRKHTTYPDDDKDKSKKIKGQREAIKKLEREVKRLKAELATLNSAFKRSADYMSTESKKLDVVDLIKAADKHQSLEEAKKEHEAKLEQMPTPSDKEAVRQKWANWIKEKNGSKNEDEDN